MKDGPEIGMENKKEDTKQQTKGLGKGGGANEEEEIKGFEPSVMEFLVAFVTDEDYL